MLDCISVKQAAEKWNISERRIQKLCEENRIDGAVRIAHAWAIPKKANKPVHGRLKANKKKILLVDDEKDITDLLEE